MCVFLRFALGLFYLFSGTQKLIEPFPNFLHVVQSYELLHPVGEKITALVVPWVEFFLGLFLVLGLWLKFALRTGLTLSLVFMFVVGQAIKRKLPITECGCFGEFLTLPLEAVFWLDFSFSLLFVLCLRRLPKTSQWSLDQLYDRK